jgi:FKBP-type peptidyl-prolyl cis-trans isomerase 2
MAERKPSRIVPTILIVIVIVVAGIGAALLYHFEVPRSTGAVETVQVGSNVTVNYIGSFAVGPQSGRVFDTSILTVATNNLSYPKALGFTWRGADSDYTPLPVAIGPNIPSGGYTIGNLTFGGVVTGFWQGLLGLPVGKARVITVPPSEGYGNLDPACLVTQPLSFSVPTVATVPASNFSTEYPNVTASAGTEFAAAPYNWTAVVLNVNATAITVENVPSAGEAVTYDGLPYVVTSVSASTIVLTSTLTAASAGLVKGLSSAICGATVFIVSAVNPAAGTFTWNYNNEVVGATLQFTVTVVSFY